MAEAIVNMAVLDCYKQTPVTPQAKLAQQGERGLLPIVPAKPL